MFDNGETLQDADCIADAIAAARDALEGAQHILLGAGSGLSSAAGLTYFGERFEAHFKNFIDYYGMSDLYSSGFYPFPDDEAAWAYWAERIWFNRYNPPSLELYDQLFSYLHNRDCFIITTNVDGQFPKAGFAPGRIFAAQGDYGFMQCGRSCHDELYPTKEAVDAIRLNTRAGERVRVSDSSLVPTCPRCGAVMIPWLCTDERFLRGGTWCASEQRYSEWLDKARASGGLVLLEMGVGFSVPDVIRFPFERLAQSDGCTLVRMNYDAASIDAPGLQAGVSVPGNIAETWPRIAGIG